MFIDPSNSGKFQFPLYLCVFCISNFKQLLNIIHFSHFRILEFKVFITHLKWNGSFIIIIIGVLLNDFHFIMWIGSVRCENTIKMLDLNRLANLNCNFNWFFIQIKININNNTYSNFKKASWMRHATISETNISQIIPHSIWSYLYNMYIYECIGFWLLFDLRKHFPSLVRFRYQAKTI